MADARILTVVVSSPNDVKLERKAISKVIEEVDQEIAAERNLVLRGVLWEKDAHPGLDVDGAQGLLDKILQIKKCDIYIGILWNRFGTPTKDAKSGTEHEFRVAYETWKEKGRPEIMFYFCKRSFNPQTPDELAQRQQVLQFEEGFPGEGLSWKFKSITELKALVRKHLITFIQRNFPPKGQREQEEEQNLTTGRTVEELFDEYSNLLFNKVGRLYIFDEKEPREINRVFVEFNIMDRYHRPAINPGTVDTESKGR